MKYLTLILIFLFSTLIGFPQPGNNLHDTINPINIGYSFSFNSKVLSETRSIFIYLPEKYDRNNNPYPVLYLFDAETNFKPVCGVVNILTRWKVIPELIVVGLPNTDRMRDVTPTHDRKFHIGGGGDNFLSFLREELIPYIDNNYNTQPFRILEGHSISGMFTMYAFTADTALFDAFIAVSPSMYWDEQIMLQKLEDFLIANPGLKKQLYITLANEPEFMLVRETVDIIRKNAPLNLTWQFKQDASERHEIAPLRSTYDGLRYFFQNE